MQESFAEELWNLPERKKKKKALNITIEEIEDEDTAPRYPRLPDTKKSILITVADLPDDYENMSPMTTKTEEDDDVENDFLIKQLREEPLPEQVAIKAKTSISQSLAHEAETGETKTFEDLVPKEYHEFRSVFEKTASERFPESRPWDHRIDLKEEFVPKIAKVYPLGQKEEEEMNKFIDDNLKKGFIRPSSSPQASPFFFISKKDSKVLRPCQDYRYLNEHMIKNAYPLPSIDDLLTKLHGAKIFTKLDI